MIYIVAWTGKQAEYAARHILKSEPFRWVKHADALYGLQRGLEIVVVEAPRFFPTTVQIIERARIREVMLAREMSTKQVILP